MEKRRVVITGLGTVNPLGNNTADSWAAAKAGKCGIGPITQFDTTDFKCKLAGEVKGFDPETIVDKKEARKMARFTVLALAAAAEAVADSGLDTEAEENIRTYFDEHEWININRQKTGVVSNIRLLDIANRIIGKYRGLCENGKIFPVPHYNTCLAGIRAVAKRCGITKHITWHQSRHTAATTVFLSNGVPIETVSSMLGHKSIKTTQIYAKITKEKLNRDMENLAAKLNTIEEFTGCNI